MNASVFNNMLTADDPKGVNFELNYLTLIGSSKHKLF
jgi:hypothetical protein